MKGLEIRKDLADVPRAILLDSETMAQVCARAATEAGATVRGVLHIPLGADSPPGLTVAILLDESHVTAHSYADDGLLALNAFTCGKRANPRKVIEAIQRAVGGREIFSDETPRFNVEAYVGEPVR